MIKTKPTKFAAVFAVLLVVSSSAPAQDITFSSLLSEMSSPDSLARFPAPAFRQMQASSYNRESTARGKPGWFADSDGTGFIREESIGGRREFVAMEHTGPGCITRLWAPFVYYDFNDRALRTPPSHSMRSCSICIRAPRPYPCIRRASWASTNAAATGNPAGSPSTMARRAGPWIHPRS